MKIGDRVYVHGYVDEIRKDTIIIQNSGGYFGTDKSEIVEAQKREEIANVIRCRDCVYFTPEKSGEHWNICRFYDAPKTADGYCNDAEPKEMK